MGGIPDKGEVLVGPRIKPRIDEAVIPPLVLAGVVEIGQRQNLSVAEWCAGTGVTPTQLVASEDIKVSFRQAAAILRRAVAAMPGRPLGMQVGGRDMLLGLGMLGVAMKSSATFADAVDLAWELHQASGSLVDIEFEVSGPDLVMSLHERAPEPEIEPFLCEEALCCAIVFIRSILGESISPKYLELAYAAPVYAQEYRRFFHCPVRFDVPGGTRMVLDSALMANPSPTHSEATRAAAVEACRRLLDLDGRRPDITVATETLLSQNLRRPPSMAATAKQLHMTERTLRRRLAETGERFSTLRDRVRERRATFLLIETAMAVEAIAAEVGFSDVREFRRAYVRWTGHPPTARRQMG